MGGGLLFALLISREALVWWIEGRCVNARDCEDGSTCALAARVADWRSERRFSGRTSSASCVVSAFERGRISPPQRLEFGVGRALFAGPSELGDAVEPRGRVGADLVAAARGGRDEIGRAACRGR